MSIRTDPPPSRPPIRPDQKSRTWAMAAHLLGLTGFIGPVVIWLIGRETDEFVDDQGKEAVNFQLVVLVAAALALPLVCLLVGFVVEAALALANIVLSITAAIRAYDGERYRYPLPFRFLR